MDGGPFRAPQPTDRRVVNRPEQSYRPSEEPQPANDEPPVYRNATPRRPPTEKRRSRRFVWPIVIVVVVILAALGGWFAWSKMQPASTPIDTTKYQAVFFTNGQVYFGKLQSYNRDYLKLTDIFYLQTQSTTASSNPQQTSTDQGGVQLIKLGDEIHGPEDSMIIARDQVLFFENLKPDGKVAQSIAKFKKTN